MWDQGARRYEGGLGSGVRGTGYGVRGTGYGVRGAGYGVRGNEFGEGTERERRRRGIKRWELSLWTNL